MHLTPVAGQKRERAAPVLHPCGSDRQTRAGAQRACAGFKPFDQSTAAVGRSFLSQTILGPFCHFISLSFCLPMSRSLLRGAACLLSAWSCYQINIMEAGLFGGSPEFRSLLLVCMFFT